MVDDNEKCVRVLRSVWIRNGVVAASAFNLRPALHETYISLLRKAMPSFKDDILLITKDDPIITASLLTRDVRVLKFDNDTFLDISEVDNQKLKSHCGLFIFINNHRIAGDSPVTDSVGKSVEVTLLKLKLAIAKMASEHVNYISREQYSMS